MNSNKIINLSSEGIFYTIQGEGKYIGYPSVFIRLTGCNLRCEWQNPDGSKTQCDTPHTSFKPEIDKWEISSIINEVEQFECEHVVITGGEPYLQPNLAVLIDELKAKGHYITIETNGTKYFETKADYISLSPKLESSSMSEQYGEMHNDKRINYNSLISFMDNHDYQFKFVLNTKEDLRELLRIRHEILGLSDTDINDKIWVMPQGISEKQFKEKEQWLFDICKYYGMKFSDRLHVRVYGHTKGV